MRSIKNKIYHKLINNKLRYNNKSITRYEKNNNKNMGNNNENKISLLQLLKKQINSIKNCELKKNATNIVFSDGNPNSKVMIIGEGPGANEDKEGKPFVGRAGKLLDKMLGSIKLNRMINFQLFNKKLVHTYPFYLHRDYLAHFLIEFEFYLLSLLQQLSAWLLHNYLLPEMENLPY